ncbi:MAG: hypothetical protein HKN32_05180 [Flavobacteriales bacterium]|nr:hypothetical protein [Flavobacteriales bacterium]
MKRLLFFTILLCSLQGLTQEKTAFKDKLYFGGDVTLSVSSTVTIIGASPLVGYRITDKWSAGVGLSYYYFSTRIGTFSNSSSIYGGNVFSRLLITDNLFAQSEFHVVNTEAVIYDPSTDTASIERLNVPMWYVGGGYRQPLGANAFASVTILYDLIDDINSPYQNPIFRGGFTFSF